jgi:menaquinol-cytochrome c reductase iron-sulfur subunit
MTPDEKPPVGTSAPTPATPPRNPAVGDDSRRDFLKTVGVGGIGLGLAAVAGAPAVAFVGYPLTHTTVTGASGLIQVGKASRFKAGPPVKVDVFADKRDAWNRVVKVKVGSAWILRDGEKLHAYSSVCPHLGCAVDYEPEGPRFGCPCHHSAFSLDGKVQGGPAPRGMDALELEEKDGVVSVRYERFRQGIAAKEVV